jgi:uncharacterized membrane protein YccC
MFNCNFHPQIKQRFCIAGWRGSIAIYWLPCWAAQKKIKQRTDAVQGVDGEFLFFLFQNDDWNKSHTKHNGAIGFGQKRIWI